jgi:dTDP-4-dehydrorhamnose reductase
LSGELVLVTGAAGQLGRQVVAAFGEAGHHVVGVTRDQLDLEDPKAGDVVRDVRPALVVNTAAWTDVDGCARDLARAMALNGQAPGRLARAAAEVNAFFCQISTNEVFDGEAETPYAESGVPRPINPYGTSKLAGERAVAESGAHHLIVRTAWIFGPGERNFPARIVAAARRAAANGQALRVVGDEVGNPTWASDLAHSILAAWRADLDGILHLAGEPAVSRFGWASAILASLPSVRLEEISADEHPRPAPVPRRAVLEMARARTAGIPLLDWRAPSAIYSAGLLEGAA